MTLHDPEQANGAPTSSGAPFALPKIFHMVWMGSDDLPSRFIPFVEKWQALHPDWQLCAWNESNLRLEILNGTPLRLFNDAPVKGNPWQFRSDIARYCLLLRFGGVYVDVDTEPMKPIDDLCKMPCWFAWEQQDKWVGNTYIGAKPGHPFVANLVLGLEDSVREYGAFNRANVVSGPQYVTRMMKAFAFKNHPVAVYPQKLLYPYAQDELFRRHEAFPEAYAIHHWNNQREMKKVPL